MAPRTLERISTSWFDLICEQLDELRQDCMELRQTCEVDDNSTIIPPDQRFDEAKFQIEKLRQLSNFPNLPDANVWLGPNGELGITWKFEDFYALELLFKDSMTARVYNQTEQARIKLSEVPRILVKLVKGSF